MAAPTQLHDLLPAPSGDQVYVSYATGNDTTGNGTIGNPWKTINKARDTIGATGIINLRYDSGTAHRPLSTERWTWQKTATAGSPITIRTYPGDSPNYITGANMAVMQGEFIAGGSGSTNYSGLRFEDIDISNTPGTARGGVGIFGFKAENFSDVEVTRCRIHDTIESATHFVGSVDAIRTENWHMHHCLIYNAGTTHASAINHDHGAYLENCHLGQIYNCVFYDCHYGTCVQFFPRGASNICAYNTMYDTSELNAPDGTAEGNPVMFFYGTSAPGLVDNVVSSNIVARTRQDATTRLAVETSGAQGSGNRLHKNLPFEITNNNLWGNNATLWVNNATRAADNLSEQDPLWTNVVAGGAKDFTLTESSPAVGAGEAAYMPDDDFAGTTRVTADIGAYAFVEASGHADDMLLTGVG